MYWISFPLSDLPLYKANPWPVHRVVYPITHAFCTYVGHVFAWETCFIFFKHQVRFTADPMFTKFEVDPPCKYITHISKKTWEMGHPTLCD